MALLGWPLPARSQTNPYRWARVTTANAGSVSIDAGSSEGLREWTRVEIVRRGRAVAVLRVITLGAHQTTCEITSRQIPLLSGDSARFLPSGRPRAEAVPPQPNPVARPAPAPRPASPAAAATPPVRRDSTVVAPAVRPNAPALRVDSLPPAVTPSRPVAPATTPVRGQGLVARVTFVTTSSAYVSAGKAEGLAEGSRVDVVRRGRPVAELRVAYVSTHQSACRIVSMADSVVVGDSVHYQPVSGSGGIAETPQRMAEAQVPTAPGGASRTRAWGRLRGRVGLYFLTVQSSVGRVSQPSGDLRLNGAGLGGSALGLTIDVRSRRVVQAFTGSPATTTDLTRVYQAAVFWQTPGSAFRITTGRQYAPGITSVGLVDGAAIEVGQAAWDYGVFAGTQPQTATLAFSSHWAQLGGYVRVHNRPAAPRHWSVTVAASGAYLDGHTNREFAYLQASVLTRRASLYAVQEVDYYRSWRRLSGEPVVSPTSTFANLQFQLTDQFTLTTGVDNRRSVRLGREFADTVFDDTFRRGIWAGFSGRFARHFLASFDARTNHDSSSGTANTFTLGLSAERLTPLGVSVRTRSARYTTRARTGWLTSIALGLEPLGRASVQVTAGWRSERGTTPISIHWLSADLDASLLRSVFIIVSAYRERGGIEGHDLLYTGVSYRF